MPVVGYFTTLEVLGHFLYPVFSFVYKRSIYALYVCLVASRKQSLSVNIANQRPSPSATLQLVAAVGYFAEGRTLSVGRSPHLSRHHV